MISPRALILPVFLILAGFVWQMAAPPSEVSPLGNSLPSGVETLATTAVDLDSDPLPRPMESVSTRLKVVSLEPAEGDRVFMSEALPNGVGQEREVEAGIWVLVQPGAWIAKLETAAGVRNEKTIFVPEGESIEVQILGSKFAQVQGRLVERHGGPSGSLDVWFLPEGSEHPENQLDGARLPRSRCTFEGDFRSPSLEPGKWSISVGPVGIALGEYGPPRTLVAGRHEVEIHIERGLRVEFTLDRMLPEGGFAGMRFELQRRVRLPNVVESQERAWRKVSAIPARRLRSGPGIWPAVRPGRYRLLLRGRNQRWACPGFEICENQDLEMSVTLPEQALLEPAMKRDDPSLELAVAVAPKVADEAWSEGMVWIN
jgi:hypothetical protein